MIGKRDVRIPKGGFFPTVGMLSSDEKVRVDLRPLTGWFHQWKAFGSGNVALKWSICSLLREWSARGNARSFEFENICLCKHFLPSTISLGLLHGGEKKQVYTETQGQMPPTDYCFIVRRVRAYDKNMSINRQRLLLWKWNFFAGFNLRCCLSWETFVGASLSCFLWTL